MRLIRSKRRTLVLQVNVQGKLVVRAPQRMTLFRIQSFVLEKQAWIDRTRQRLQKKYITVKPPQFTEGELFWYLGVTYPLRLISEVKEPLILTDCFVLAAHFAVKAHLLLKKWYMAEAARIIEERVQYFCEQFQFTYTKIRLSSAEKRWGSCSVRNTLNFSWKLIMAPVAAIDYVVVHELVHTQHKNHGKRFWSKVENVLPHYRVGKRWLKEHGHLLIWISGDRNFK